MGVGVAGQAGTAAAPPEALVNSVEIDDPEQVDLGIAEPGEPPGSRQDRGRDVRIVEAHDHQQGLVVQWHPGLPFRRTLPGPSALAAC